MLNFSQIDPVQDPFLQTFLFESQYFKLGSKNFQLLTGHCELDPVHVTFFKHSFE